MHLERVFLHPADCATVPRSDPADGPQVIGVLPVAPGDTIPLPFDAQGLLARLDAQGNLAIRSGARTYVLQNYVAADLREDVTILADDGSLKELNRRGTGGSGPCHVTTDPTGQCVLAANYGGGSVCAISASSDGSLLDRSAFIQHPAGSNKDPNRQKDPHAHSANVSADGKYAVVADLGCDKLFVYKLNTGRGTLDANDPPATSAAPTRIFSLRVTMYR